MVEVLEADEKVRKEEEMRVKVTAVLGILSWSIIWWIMALLLWLLCLDKAPFLYCFLPGYSYIVRRTKTVANARNNSLALHVVFVSQ